MLQLHAWLGATDSKRKELRYSAMNAGRPECYFCALPNDSQDIPWESCFKGMAMNIKWKHARSSYSRTFDVDANHTQDDDEVHCLDTAQT